MHVSFLASTETVSLKDAAHREVQRRNEASVDHAAGLPPDVVAVLTMFDAVERNKEESHNAAHKRFADTVTRFFDKLHTEETKYNNRMEELQVRACHVTWYWHLIGPLNVIYCSKNEQRCTSN